MAHRVEPALGVAREAERFEQRLPLPEYLLGREGANAPAALNAANEEAVAAFLAGRLPFPGIAEVVTEVLERHRPPAALDLAALLATERWSRGLARTLVEDLTTSRGTR